MQKWSLPGNCCSKITSVVNVPLIDKYISNEIKPPIKKYFDLKDRQRENGTKNHTYAQIVINTLSPKPNSELARFGDQNKSLYTTTGQVYGPVLMGGKRQHVNTTTRGHDPSYISRATRGHDPSNISITTRGRRPSMVNTTIHKPPIQGSRSHT